MSSGPTCPGVRRSARSSTPRGRPRSTSCWTRAAPPSCAAPPTGAGVRGGRATMRNVFMLAVSVLGLALPGCGDAVKRMLADPSSRARLMDGIGGDSSLTGEMIERLLTADGSRAIVFEHVLANGQARQAAPVEVAGD